MHRNRRFGFNVTSVVAGAGILSLAVIAGCPSSGPIPVLGPQQFGNVLPTLTILEPADDLSVAQGERFLITWSDGDADNNALISFSLIDTISGFEIPLVSNIEENDTRGADSFSVSTGLVPRSTYNIRGTIADGINAPVTVFATKGEPANQRVVLTITDPGQAPPTTPPVAVVTEPSFNISVSQDDLLTVMLQPTAIPPAANTPPYDPDSDVTLYILLDVDSNPNNDNVVTDQPGNQDGIIVLSTQTIMTGTNAVITFNRNVDLNEIPTRPDGRPYFVRATLIDGTNVPRHEYANGTIQIVEAAQGIVDVATVGQTRSGARFQGFNPGSRLGHRMISVRDFDNDGIDDMLLVARFGNPSNFGNVGEAYLIYGLDNRRFGGNIDVNSTSTAISGTIFAAPPLRGLQLGIGNARTEGITDVSVISDLNFDGRPELLFGMAHHDGLIQGRDDDPGDSVPMADATVMVTVVVRGGESSVRVGMGDPMTDSYIGAEDGYIDAAAPNANFAVGDLEFQGPPDSKWVLLTFSDLLDVIPDTPADIVNVMATLRMRVFDPGDMGNLHEAFTEYNENTTTYANYAQNGGDPEEDVDYSDQPLGGVNGAVGEVMVTVTPVLQRLIDGQLSGADDELRFIIVPSDMDGDNVQLRSSEFNVVPIDRPTLTITYNRRNLGGAFGCYIDPYANNVATEANDDIAGIFVDQTWEALGLATIVHSNNRDAASAVGINPDRLEETVVWLELVGQEVYDFIIPAPTTGVFALAQGSAAGRIDGCRFTSGWYDFIDHQLLNQPPLNDLFGWNVSSLPDVDNDQLDEILISAPRNERDILDTTNTFGGFSTHVASRGFTGSIIVLPGTNYNNPFFRDKADDGNGNSCVPFQCCPRQRGSCTGMIRDRGGPAVPADSWEIFAENVDDFLAGAQSAGDFNLDGVPDILCGAHRNDRSDLVDSGAAYIIYGRTPTGDVRLELADNPGQRPPMLRLRGERSGDQVGFSLATGLDFNGDRIDDVFIGAPSADVGNVPRPDCLAGLSGLQLSVNAFNDCRDSLGEEVFSDDACKGYDFNNDRQLDDDDLTVLNCLLSPAPSNCCPVDNGFVGVIFGGVSVDGDRTLSQIGTNDLPGIRFFGAHAGDRAGHSVSSAGDFNQDGFGDLLIAAPGEVRMDNNLRTRVGVAYLIFGGTHLTQPQYSLDMVGTADLPGIVFLSPFVEGRPNEAPIDNVGLVGDINNDGFDDIGLGITRADFIDQSLPQDPNDPGTNPNIGRRPDDGNAYIVYGNNVGSNRVR